MLLKLLTLKTEKNDQLLTLKVKLVNLQSQAMNSNPLMHFISKEIEFILKDLGLNFNEFTYASSSQLSGINSIIYMGIGPLEPLIPEHFRSSL